MEPVRLERLLMEEVSAVDDPANQLPGWLVTKSVEGGDPLFALLGEEMEALVKAAASKEPYGDVKYADPGYQSDGKKRYPLDTETHVRAAWSYINQEDNASAYSADQLDKIKGRIKAAMTKLGAKTEKSGGVLDIVAKVKGIVLGAPTGKEGIDMDRAELETILDAHDEALVKSVTEAVTAEISKSSPAEGEGATETTPLTADDVAKAIVEGINESNKTTFEVLEKTLDRVEAIEKHLGVAARASLDGQENGAPAEGATVEKSTPDLTDAVAKALQRPKRA